MLLSRNMLLGRGKYLFAFLLLSSISVICVAFSMSGNDDFNISRREVLLRRIGHELLLQAGDSTSRVLPVERIAENEYQISFEKDLTFRPDTLSPKMKKMILCHVREECSRQGATGLILNLNQRV